MSTSVVLLGPEEESWACQGWKGPPRNTVQLRASNGSALFCACSPRNRAGPCQLAMLLLISSSHHCWVWKCLFGKRELAQNAVDLHLGRYLIKNQGLMRSAAAVGKCSSNVHIIHRRGMSVLYSSKRRKLVETSTMKSIFVQYCWSLVVGFGSCCSGKMWTKRN